MRFVCRSPEMNSPAEEKVSLDAVIRVGPGGTKAAVTSWAGAPSCSPRTLA